jgi:hypothetical protein
MRPGGVKPYVMAGAGPIFGSSAGAFVSRSSGTPSISGAHTETAAGGPLGGGVDFHLARSITVGVNAAYVWMSPFAQPVGARTKYSGPQVGMSFGFLFGKETR